MIPTPRTVRFALPLLALAALGGCIAPADHRLGVGSWTPEAIVPAPTPIVGAIDEQKPDQASISSLSRGNWEEHRVLVEREAVLHYPTYRSDPAYTHAMARQRGEYPTADTALETTNGDSIGQQALEGVAFPFWAAMDIPLIIPRLFTQPPMSLQKSPTSNKPRLPEPAASAPASNAPVAAPTAP